MRSDNPAPYKNKHPLHIEHHLIYVSRAAADLPPASVTKIFSQSRTRNPAQGIVGALLFDGEYFAQWLAGAAGAVEALYDTIAADARHHHLAVLRRGPPREPPPLGRNFQAGWAAPDSVSPLYASLDIEAAFTRLMARCDLA